MDFDQKNEVIIPQNYYLVRSIIVQKYRLRHEIIFHGEASFTLMPHLSLRWKTW